jgi:hypothetical protein
VPKGKPFFVTKKPPAAAPLLLDTFYPYGYHGCILSIHISVNQYNKKDSGKRQALGNDCELKRLEKAINFWHVPCLI